MRSLKPGFVIIVVVLLGFAGSLLAQETFPEPTGPGEPLATWNGLNLYPYSSPFAAHTGRFVDASFTKDFLVPTPRTLRAKSVRVAPESGRVYMMMGEHFVAYNLSSFFTSDLGKPLSMQLTRNHVPYPERYLQWAGDVYPESAGSGWSTYVLDGQQRLFDFDWDDRGYAYVAYYIWGFGIVQDSNMRTVRQVDWNETAANPRLISSFKSNNKYYVVVSGEKAEIWDVTQPTSPTKIRTLPERLGSVAVANLGGSQVIGLTVARYDASLGKVVSKFEIYRASDFVLGGAPVHEMTATGTLNAVATDGTNFYVAESSSSSLGFTINTFLLTNQQVPTYTRSQYPISGFSASGMTWGAGHLAVWGSDRGGSEIRLYRLENDVPVERDLGDFIRNYYTTVNPPEGYTNAAKDGYTAAIMDAQMIEHGGKEYLAVSAYGLGDVYELESPDRLTISTSNGTTAYYGDPIQFSSAFQAGSINVNWNFGNPEGIAAENVRTAPANQSITHQYAGLTTAAAIQSVRTVTATDATNSANSDSVTVTMKVPSARSKIQGTSHVFPGADITKVGVVRGDSFIDNSDGTAQSHYVDWTLDGTTTSATPSTPVTIGTCGQHTLAQTSRYVPYTGSGTSVTPKLDSSKHFTSSVAQMSFEAKPFIPVVTVSSTADTVTFLNATRFKAGTFNAGAQWNVNWQLKDASGNTIDSETDATSVGTADTYVIAKTAIQAGYSVVMGVSVEAATLVDTSCAAQSYLSQTATFKLDPPDPQIVKDGCTAAQGSCVLSLTSLSGKETSGWTVAWYLANQLVSTSATYQPNLQTAGTYQIRARATNDFGVQEATISITVTAPVCSGYATAISINYHGVNSNCTGSACTDVSEAIEFSPYAWGYSFQDCDNFNWNFGDGTTSTQKVVQHKFATAKSYTVRLTVSNNNGQTSTTTTLTFGSGGGGNPNPEPTCPTTAPPQGQVFAEITGPTSGCTTLNPNCAPNEQISFRGTTYPYRPQSCDTFRWNFGDGTSATGLNATHSYSAGGTYTATFTVTNSRGSSSGSVTITVGTPDTCPNAPVLVDIGYTGPTSGCTATNSTGCLPNEAIKFTPQTWQYNWQECDQFSWNFGDGSTSNLREPTHTYTTGGDKTVTLTVTNTKGSQTVSRTFLVGTPATPPTTASITYSPARPKPGETMTFSASTNGGDPATSWQWNFGDGTTGSGQTVSHKFTAEGTFKVALTAANSGGSAYTEKSVQVSDTLTYLLPVVTHAGGQNGSTWRTDLHVYQPEFTSTGAIEVALDFKGTTTNMFFDSSTEIFEDFLGEITSNDDAGPVFLHTSVPIDMWTRTYNVSSSGVGTYGQLIPAVLLGQSGQGAVADQTYWNLGGLRNSDRFRTNLGFVNPTGQPAVVTVHIYEEKFGLEIGKFDVTINPYQLRQEPLKAWFSSLPANEGVSLRIQSRNGVDVMTYASVIDNISGDPVFMGAIPDSVAADPAAATMVVPGVGHAGSWRSDLTIFNPDSNAASMNLEFYSNAGQKLGEAPSVILPSKGSMTVEDLLRSTLMNVEGDVIGTLRVTTTSPNEMFPIIFDRTYSDQMAEGTFGQGIPAFPVSAANVAFQRPAFIPGVRNDSAYRTNVGLVSLSSQPTEVTIQLLHPNTGQPTHANTLVLLPNQSTIIPRALSDFLLSSAASGALKIVVQSGGPVWAYGSVIDNLTEDPEYVPAVPSALGTASLTEEDTVIDHVMEEPEYVPTLPLIPANPPFGREDRVSD